MVPLVAWVISDVLFQATPFATANLDTLESKNNAGPLPPPFLVIMIPPSSVAEEPLFSNIN